MEALDTYPLSIEIWETHVPKRFKPPSLATFYGRSDPYEHVISINTQMVSRVEYYIKYEEGNTKKNTQDVKERVPNAEVSHPEARVIIHIPLGIRLYSRE